MAKTAKKKRPATSRGGRSPARRDDDEGRSILPTRELIEHQRALRRLARALQRAGLEEFATQILELLARFRSAILDALVRQLGNDEPQTRNAAMRALMELLVGDPSIAGALAQARDTTTDPEIRDRLRRLLRANPALYRQQVKDIGDEVGIVFLALLAPPPSFQDGPELQRLLDELRNDALEAMEDADAAETDLNESSIRDRFKRSEARERRRQARKPFIDQLRKEIFGD